ncbi:hypothetical protein RUM44_008160 [Polyplax serrata]|uniref:Uncharacterized protein n=1 Tax=Polyplax serrata TaxID=468196 RepID=A0ABR1BCE4_POLSC
MYGFRDRQERELKVLENLDLHIAEKRGKCKPEQLVSDSHGHLTLFRVHLTVRDVDTGQAGEHWAAVKICTPGIVKV